MGACASVPKAMRDEAAAVAPPPEQPQEDTSATVPAVETVVQEDSSDDKKKEKAVLENNESQSLGTLLVEGEAPKENIEVVKAKDFSVSEPATVAEEKATDAAEAPPAVVTAP